MSDSYADRTTRAPGARRMSVHVIHDVTLGDLERVYLYHFVELEPDYNRQALPPTRRLLQILHSHLWMGGLDILAHPAIARATAADKQLAHRSARRVWDSRLVKARGTETGTSPRSSP
jgi:hypothetical protein